MTPVEFEATCHELGWDKDELAGFLGKHPRMLYRYLENKPPIPTTVARLLRLLALLRVTVSEEKFAQIVSEIMKD